ncbi:MAG: transglycosylase SLT domain-containing protein [Novosphingobium sp.]|uniref:transglycosylase SLT domain-containing protein n=1 Tax=Novosphingobium sp. TaxID=1874826 RepID=UPI0032BB635A
MSEARSIGAAAHQSNPQAEAAILRAAQATGVDFAYLLGEARLESSLDPNARAGTSSAAGLFQFTQGTWLATLDQHGAQYGYGWANDPAKRGQALELRFDPQASALMAAELANDNRDHLHGVLGRDPDPSELYLAHFLGADGAGKFLSALAANPGQSAAALFPKAAAANRAIFFAGNGQPRTLAAVMDLIRTKMTHAMDGAAMPFAPNGSQGWGEAGWPEPGWEAGFQGTPGAPQDGYDPGPPAAAPPRPSMAETLASAFGGSPDAMPGHVRTAYGKLQAFGL